jgi:antitoxin component YwqK of YwqJK toxin-antitoxin module
MKKNLVLFIFLVMLFACSSEKMNFSKLQDRNGLYYLVNEDKPYSGEIVSYLNGKAEFEGQIENGLRVGTWVFYYPSGQKKMEGSYKEGLKDGNWTSWQENGQQDKVEVYKYGKLLTNEGTTADTEVDSVAVEGVVKKQSQSMTSKQPEKEVVKKPAPVVWESLHGGPVKYLNSVPYTGAVVKYFKNGKIELEGYFVSGKRSGKWTFYTTYGTVKNVMYY